MTIDGVNQGTVDLYAPSTQAQAGVSFGGLASATHTIVVKALGTKNASSSGTAVAVDGFAVGTTTTQETANAFTFSSWAGAASASASGGTYRSSAAANATVSFTFTGSAVDWVTATGAYGQATVTIDGIAQGTFDLSSPTAAWQVKKSFSGLGPGPHTIVIKVLGTKSPSSTSAKVVVDAFVVAHSDLEFREFFLRLQRLAAWHDLLANLDALHG